MNQLGKRFKGHKKAIHPVIAVIILIAVTLVLALVVGAYTFGLFGSNVKTITISSVELSPSDGVMSFAMSNAGSSATVSSLALSGASIASPITGWTYTNSAATPSCTGAVQNCANQGTVTTLTATPSSPPAGEIPLTSGQTFNYVIAFSNGQSITGVIVAQ